MSRKTIISDDYVTKEAYFAFFEQLCKKNEEKSLLVKKIKSICLEMTQLLDAISSNNSFETIARLLGLDTKLQIISTFINEPDLSEQLIIKMAENDYKVYFKEDLSDLSESNSPSLHLLMK